MQRWYLWLPPSLSCGLFLFSDNKSTKRSRLCSLCVSAHMLKWVKSGQMCPNACFPCIQILNRQVSPTPPPPLPPPPLLPPAPPSFSAYYIPHKAIFFPQLARCTERKGAGDGFRLLGPLNSWQAFEIDFMQLPNEFLRSSLQSFVPLRYDCFAINDEFFLLLFLTPFLFFFFFACEGEEVRLTLNTRLN